ncbi:hypothetical protein KY290_036365 [Solanum tuberosum]|uniref:Uncharacterized protein n=1 Tax=Solanum tuberosum TaxID=4113 RepID=A0ABQ7TW65_SOLTU|nr:hypothetical protein KY289_035885 [Solanum tuberosum]KAH0641023.1 hypothetical protein KY285_037609 [Solanum tuberosum]KAH0737660.1 hypothetical protein KY290_036365 [Solanum tuberosum]
MDPNSQNSQLTQVLNDVLGLVKDDSLLSQNDEHDQDSDVAYGDEPEAYLHSDHEGLLYLVYEEMNQPEQEKSISVSDKEEYEVDEELNEDEDTINDNNFTDQQYIEGPIAEHSRLTDFGVVKKSSKKKGCEYARKISRTLKRSLEAHDITGIRPAKSIRLLEVQAGGPDRMGCTLKDCRCHTPIFPNVKVLKKSFSN